MNPCDTATKLSPKRALANAAPAFVPTLALQTSLAILAALTPVPAAAASEPYVNTQFVDQRAGEERGRLVIRNTSVLPRKVYARFELPSDPNNRNNGFVQTVPPLSTIAYDLPIGVRVFACDGKYWDNYRPDEAFAVTISAADTYTFTAREFKPVALRRRQGK